MLTFVTTNREFIQNNRQPKHKFPLMPQTLHSRALLSGALVLAMPFAASAQSAWLQHHAAKSATVPMTALTPAITTGANAAESAARPLAARATSVDAISIGYCSPSDYIYESDGITPEADSNVGAAVLLTKEHLGNYVGGVIRSLQVGWNNRSYKPSVKAFVRENINGTDLASAKFTPTNSVGWNTVKLDKGIEITADMDSLYLGLSLKLTTGNYLPTLYPHNVKNSCLLYQEGDNDANGNPIWRDLNEMGQLALMATVEDAEGKFHNIVSVPTFQYDILTRADSTTATQVRIYNRGTNDIGSIGIQCTQGDSVWSEEFELQTPIAPGYSAKYNIPVHCFKSGPATYTFNYVNGEVPTKPFTAAIDQIAVPKDVAAKYVKRPLIEFYTNENSVYGPTYYGYITSGLGDMRDRYTVISVHNEDQFMTGSESDDAITMQLALLNNDSTLVYIPAESIDRNTYSYSAWGSPGRLATVGHTLYDQAGSQVYSQILNTPTFAAVTASGSVNDDAKAVSIDVDGDIADGVMPEGEPLYLSVYLVEHDVKSTSQKFWDESEEEKYGGEYTHECVIRRRLTPLFGTEITTENGKFHQHFDQRISSKWAADKLGVIAFINRGEQNAADHRQVINSTECLLTPPAGIADATASSTGRVVAVYTTSGVQLPVNEKPAPGVYLVKRIVNGKSVVTKEVR